MLAFMTCIYLFTIGVKMDLKWIHFAFTCMWALTNVCEKLYLLPAATKLWPRLCFYTCVWFCSRGGSPGRETPLGRENIPLAGKPRPRAGRTPRSRHPPGPDPPPRNQTPAYGLRAAGTHPTGMHSCSLWISKWFIYTDRDIYLNCTWMM